jgi:hypothetical protein
MFNKDLGMRTKSRVVRHAPVTVVRGKRSSECYIKALEASNRTLNSENRRLVNIILSTSATGEDRPISVQNPLKNNMRMKTNLIFINWMLSILGLSIDTERSPLWAVVIMFTWFAVSCFLLKYADKPTSKENAV